MASHAVLAVAVLSHSDHELVDLICSMRLLLVTAAAVVAILAIVTCVNSQAIPISGPTIKIGIPEALAQQYPNGIDERPGNANHIQSLLIAGNRVVTM